MKFVELKDICQIVVGGDAPQEAFSKNKTAEFPVPVLSNGIAEKALYGYTNRAKVSEPSVTISARGTIGFPQYQDRPYFPIVRLICLIPNENLSAKFLKYFLETYKFPKTISAIPQLTTAQVKNLLIPLPPLEVQEKIVHFLDLLTSLIFALENEKAERERQFQFYLKKWLAGTKGKKYKFLDLLSIRKGEIVNSDEVLQKGKYPIYKAGTTYSGFYNKKNSDGNAITVVTYGASSGYINFIEKEFFLGGGRSLLELKNEGIASYKFIYFYLKCKQDEFLNSKNIGAITNLDKSIFSNFVFQLPPLYVQQRIVKNLDVLNTLVFNDLPKEIALRKQQFQHYLNRIFEALNAK